MRCLYLGSDVWWPQRSRARCTRSSRGKCCSSVGSMGEGWVPSSVFGSALSSVLWVYVVCMWVRRDVLSESGGKESNSLWYSWVTFRCVVNRVEGLGEVQGFERVKWHLYRLTMTGTWMH